MALWWSKDQTSKVRLLEGPIIRLQGQMNEKESMFQGPHPKINSFKQSR